MQYPFPYPSQNHGCSECSEHSSALSSSTWLDPHLSKDSAEKASLLPTPPTHTYTAPQHSLPFWIQFHLFFPSMSPPSTLWWPHRIGRHQDSAQILRTVAMLPCLPLRRRLKLLKANVQHLPPSVGRANPILLHSSGANSAEFEALKSPFLWNSQGEEALLPGFPSLPP